MTVIAYKARKQEPAKAGVTLFLHVRQTTLIAHLAPPRRIAERAQTPKKTSRRLT